MTTIDLRELIKHDKMKERNEIKSIQDTQKATLMRIEWLFYIRCDYEYMRARKQLAQLSSFLSSK